MLTLTSVLIFAVIVGVVMAITDIMDFFKDSNAFGMTTMTNAINKQPFVPGRIGSLGLFAEQGVPTTSIIVERKDGLLTLVPNTPRGAPGNPMQNPKAVVRSFMIPHFPVTQTVMAEEIQNVRGFGKTTLETLQDYINSKSASMVPSLDATLEYGRIGAVKGIIYDADGSTAIYNLFTEFGISQTSVDFVLGTAGTDVNAKCLAVKRAVEDALGMAMYDRIHVVCGKTWFEKFTNHAEVKEAWKRWNDGQKLREDKRRGFEFAGVFFEEYRGAVGAVDFVAASEAHAFPIGVPGLFETYFAPAPYMDAVNTPGLPRYFAQELMEFKKGVKLEAQTNPLSLCRMPEVLIKLTTSN